MTGCRRALSRCHATACVLLSLWAFATGRARAQDAPQLVLPAITLSVAALAGSVGELRGVASAGSADSTRDRDGMASVWGVTAIVSHDVNRFFSVGLMAQYVRWKNQSATTSTGFMDVGVVPRLQYRFRMGHAIGTVFLQASVGIGWVSDLIAPDSEVDASVTPALALGVAAGFEALLTRVFGLFLQMGWLHHAFSVKASFDDGTRVQPILDANFQTDQPFIQAGVTFVLVASDDEL